MGRYRSRLGPSCRKKYDTDLLGVTALLHYQRPSHPRIALFNSKRLFCGPFSPTVPEHGQNNGRLPKNAPPPFTEWRRNDRKSRFAYAWGEGPNQDYALSPVRVVLEADDEMCNASEVQVEGSIKVPEPVSPSGSPQAAAYVERSGTKQERPAPFFRVGNPHAGICEGSVRQPAVLPQ